MSEKELKIEPVNFELDWEILSKNRKSVAQEINASYEVRGDIITQIPEDAKLKSITRP